MEFKGTKGRWDYVYENNQFEVYHEPETNGDFITTAICENEANALLISKAPEMLEMLQRAKDKLYTVQSPSTSCRMLGDEIEKLIKEVTDI